MAMCVIPMFGEAPCQCLTPGGIRTTSPGRISSIGPPHCWTRPAPAVTIKTWPAGCVCHAERAPGSNVTKPPEVREGSLAGKSGSTRTEPVKYWAQPFADDWEPLRAISIVCACRPAEARSTTNAVIALRVFIQDLLSVDLDNS